MLQKCFILWYHDIGAVQTRPAEEDLQLQVRPIYPVFCDWLSFCIRTRSRAEGFKWWELQRNEWKAPDLDLLPAFMYPLPQTSRCPKNSHYRKPHHIKCLGSLHIPLLHLSCPVIHALCGFILVRVCRKGFPLETFMFWVLWPLTLFKASLQSRKSEGDHCPSTMALWHKVFCLLLFHSCLCADNWPSWRSLDSQALVLPLSITKLVWIHLYDSV